MSGERFRDEAAAVVERYSRRDDGDRYSPLQLDVCQTLQERQRALIGLLARHGVRDLAGLRLLEVGCGSGGNLLEWLRLGGSPEGLTGLELLPERLAQARRVLPPTVSLRLGDALEADIGPGSQDLVLQSTVFSSLLDDAFQARLAAAMWRWLRPGGAVLWYDLAVNNPRNADVRGMPLARVQALFPAGRIDARRVTLAPPLARAVARRHAGLYGLFNLLLPLRTHRLAWIGKPA
jgi:SAM-dependent methyltransferase